MTCPRCAYEATLPTGNLIMPRTPQHAQGCPRRLHSGDQGTCGRGARHLGDKYAKELLRGLTG